MTTRTDHLALIKATIDTQYDLARIELFRPFEVFDRFHGIKASAFPSHARECMGKIEFHSYGFGDFALSADEWDVLGKRLFPFTLLAREVKDGHATATPDVFQNVASCACEQRAVVYSVRVSITWNGRILMREYLLPEAAK